MSDINLLKDKDSFEGSSKKKRAKSAIEYTAPVKEKDEVTNKLKKGGVFALFSSLFKRKAAASSEKNLINGRKVIKESTKEEKVKEKGKEFIPASISYEKKPPVEKKEHKKTILEENNVAKKEPSFIPSSKEKKISPLERLFHPSFGSKNIEKKYQVDKATIKETPDQSTKTKEKKIMPSSSVSSGEEKTPQPPQEIPVEEKFKTLDVNLIPEEMLMRLEPKNKLKQLGLVVVIIIVLVGLSYGFLLYQQSQIKGKVAEVTKEILLVEQEISKYADTEQEAMLLKKKIDSISTLLNSHIYWSQFLSYLEQYTLPGVYYTNLSGTTAGKITLSAKAVDLPTLSNQYIIFLGAEDFVKSVKIDSAGIGQGEGETAVVFSISLDINPEIFYKNYHSSK